MATLLKVLNNLADTKSAGVLHFASELGDAIHYSMIGDNRHLNAEALERFDAGLLRQPFLLLDVVREIVRPYFHFLAADLPLYGAAEDKPRG